MLARKKFEVLEWYIVEDDRYVKLSNNIMLCLEKYKDEPEVWGFINQFKDANRFLLGGEKLIVPRIQQDLVTLYIVDRYEDGSFWTVENVIRESGKTFVEVKSW